MKDGPKALVTGAGGQVGRELQSTVPAGWSVAPCTLERLDVTDAAGVDQVLEQERPAVVIHTAAYTAVDAAEDDPHGAAAANVEGSRNVARAAARLGARVVYLSTDYVFDGAQGRPYAPDDVPNPLNVYGRTKLGGEREVAAATDGEALILRTAWVYSVHGSNFVKTMLSLMASRDELTVVADQVGTPTSARSLAEAVWAFAVRPDLRGVHHWTDAGVASWYDFALAIQEEARGLGLLERAAAVRPVRSDAFPARARRPAFSVLDKTATWATLAVPVRHWRAQLRATLASLAEAAGSRIQGAR